MQLLTSSSLSRPVPMFSSDFFISQSCFSLTREFVNEIGDEPSLGVKVQRGPWEASQINGILKKCLHSFPSHSRGHFRRLDVCFPIVSFMTAIKECFLKLWWHSF
ncbi:hypothetical protein CDAR_164041 [Caerostris darwini]|uniref:Uncharacterized protein n=1 Tax=Caerostris darwini TaxID=1538125 RepID=A0AAV4UW13_9ARAC|nr:hypothetical protein CDAR_164041 [Caerostris darwini]